MKLIIVDCNKIGWRSLVFIVYSQLPALEMGKGVPVPGPKFFFSPGPGQKSLVPLMSSLPYSIGTLLFEIADKRISVKKTNHLQV